MAESLNLLLKNTVRVLVVDDEPVILQTLKDNFNFFPVYSIYTASSTSEAMSLLEGRAARYHVCIIDRGLNDVEGNEFYLMDKFRKNFPFVVITGKHDSEKGFECAEHGAKMVLSKGRSDFHNKLLRYVNFFALRNIICPGCHESPAPFVCRFMETLCGVRPYRVNELARALKISGKSLRDAWMKYVGIGPKYSLCIFHLYSKVFEYIEGVGCKSKAANFGKHEEKITRDSLNNIERYRRYYSRNRKLIESFIRNRSRLID